MIRAATKGDLPEINKIYNQAVDQGYCTAHLAPMNEKDRSEWFRIHDHTYPVYVMEEEGKVVGWSSLSPYRPGREALRDVAELSIYVDYNVHRRGIGSRLVQYNLTNARSLGKRIYFAVIIEGNEASIRLLKKFGFEQWAFLPDVVNIRSEKRGHIYMGLILNNKV